MTQDPSIHWYEGLFLQPHHLQQMQRRMGQTVRRIPGLMTPFPYGLVESSFSGDDLANKRVRFDSLRAVMPSGLQVTYPGNAVLESISFAQQFAQTAEGLTVYLAVPLWNEQGGNTVEYGETEPWKQKRLYRVDEQEAADENTGENPQPLRVRNINARLIVEGDDMRGMEVLPVLRIVRELGEEVGTPRADPAFIPPSLTLTSSPQLRQMLRDVTNLLNASRAALVEQNVLAELRKDTVRGPQLESFLRLQCVSRFTARCEHCLRHGAFTPFGFDGLLRELLADLSPLRPELGAFDVSAYDHDNPGPVFRELMRLVRQALQGEVVETFIKVDFRKEGNRFYASLKPEHFDLPTAYYLGIRSKQDSRAVAALVEDENRFKLLPKSMQEAAIFGVALGVDHSPPVELPSPGKGLLYFRLDPSERARLWGTIREEKEVVVDGPSDSMSDFKLALYMLLPDQGGQ